MALSLEEANLTKQRARAETRHPKIQAALKALFSYLSQHKGNPKLQFVAFATLSSASAGLQIVADAACRVVAVYVKKPAGSTTAAWLKLSDHATAVSTAAPELSLTLPTNDEIILTFPDGLAMANGAIVGSYTAGDGQTGSSAADRPSGFVIIEGA